MRIVLFGCIWFLVSCGPRGGGEPDAHTSDADLISDGGDTADADDGPNDGGDDGDVDSSDGDLDGDGDGGSDACRPASVVAAISQERIRATLTELTSLPERSTHANQGAAVELLRRRLRDQGLEPLVHEYDWRGQRWVNLEIVITGTELPDEIYAAGAHYDSTSTDPRDAPGADDNGSGTAAVVEIARALSGCSFRRTIRLLLFSNEEQGMIGSAAYAREARARGDDIRGFLNLDMIAYGPPGEDLDVATRPAYSALAQRVVAATERWTPLDTVTHIDDHCG